MYWIYENNIQVDSDPFIMYVADPNIVNPDDMVYNIVIPISEDVEGNDEIKIKTFPGSTVLYTIHKGSYTSLPDVYEKIWDYIFENKYEMTGLPKKLFFNYLKDASPEELLTEIQFPIKN